MAASATAIASEVLRLAASVEQLSPHVLAASIVPGPRDRGLALSMPVDVVERPAPGSRAWWTTGASRWGRPSSARASMVCRAGPGTSGDERRSTDRPGFVRIDDAVRGALTLDDPLRSETPRAIRSLRRIGFTRIVMVTGDNAAVADIIGSAIGVDAVLADRAPSEKVEAVEVERSNASGPIVMVGDGLNDAPALALADVGVAMGPAGPARPLRPPTSSSRWIVSTA